jgi:hypothetical protein
MCFYLLANPPLPPQLPATMTGSFTYTCTVNNKALKSHLERPAVAQGDLVFRVSSVHVEDMMGMMSEGAGAPPASEPQKVGMYSVEVFSKEAGQGENE